MSFRQVKPTAFRERIARVAYLLGLKTTNFTIQPSTQEILNRLRDTESSTYSGRTSGKTTAILLYARELMAKHHTDDVYVISPWDEGSHTHAIFWERMFPYEASPKFTTNINDVRGHKSFFLIDEPSYLPFDARDKLVAMCFLGGPQFCGSVGS